MTDSAIKRLFSKIPAIETNRLILRRLLPSDYRDMYEYASLGSVTKYLLWNPHDSVDYTYNYLENLQGCYKRGEFFDWGIELKSEKKLIGTCGYTEIINAHKRAEIGYVLNPSYWGQGIMPEAVMAVISFAFGELEMNRIEAHFMEGNTRSLSVMKKCGMRYEGMFRDYMYVKNKYVNIGICGITADSFDMNREYYRHIKKQTGFFGLF